MADTFTCCLHYHIVFSTKHRKPWIKHSFEERLWAYLGGIANRNRVKPLLVGGMEDHVHLLVGMPPTVTVSETLKQLKGGSSGWVKDNLPCCRMFAWQDGYGAFTVSKSNMSEAEQYIINQREHHRMHTFQEEYRALLDRHGIAYDERYLWD